MPRPDDAQHLVRRLAALLRPLDRFRTREVLPGDACRVGQHLGGRAGGDDLAAAHTRAGAEIDEEVGGAHRVLVVLDDQDGVADVPQVFEAPQQLFVVPRVQADRRLVEDVEDAHEARTDLPGQADALGLAAGERRGGAVQAEVVQADVQEEPEAVANLLEQLAGDRPLHDRQRLLVSVEPRGELADGGVADLDEGLVADADGAGLRVEALAVARGALDDAHELFELHAPRPGGRLLELREQLRDDALPLTGVLPDLAAALLPLPDDVRVPRAGQEQIAVRLGQLVPRRFQVDAERLADAFVDVLAPLAHALQAADDRDSAVVEAHGVVWHDEVGVEGVTRADAVALGAHAERAVEREQLRRRRLVADSAVRARVVRTEEQVGRRGLGGRLRLLARPRLARFLRHVPLDGDDHFAAGERERLLDRLGDAGPQLAVSGAGVERQAVDDDVDGVLDLLVELLVVRHLDDAAVDPGADVALLDHVREVVLELALLRPHDRSEYQEARARRE